jgi:hypothetical protein
MASSRATPRPCSSPPSPPFHLRTAATKQPPTRVSKQTVKMHSSRFERLAARGRAQSSGAHQPAGTARRLSRRQQHAEHSKTWHAAAAADPCRSASNLVLDKTAPTATVPRATPPSAPARARSHRSQTTLAIISSCNPRAYRATRRTAHSQNRGAHRNCNTQLSQDSDFPHARLQFISAPRIPYSVS